MNRFRAVSMSLLVLLCARLALPQIAGTGAIAGTVTDPSGAVIEGAKISVKNETTGETRTINSTPSGHYSIELLPPGSYVLIVTKSGFKEVRHTGILVHVTETDTVNLTLPVGTISEMIVIQSEPEQLQTETSSLGNVTTQEVVENLPLATRNYTQIIGLSPGVNAEVTDAGTLGRGNGGIATTSGTFSAGGSSVMDNSYQLNGANVNDLQQSSIQSGGFPIPNPDTIQEFKVQTVAYDASYGRAGGANVNLVTKSGTDSFHGTVFEFFRNTALNANNYFLKQNHQPRPVEQQNQFGFTLGGPIVKDKVLFFLSYQGTRQKNGVDANCSTFFIEPGFTDTNRTSAALGAMFVGQPTFASQATGVPGVTVALDGSNISTQALTLLNAKLPDGSFLIPSAQTIDPSLPPSIAGSAAISTPCPFTEDQYMGNVDWNQSTKSVWQERFFFLNSHETLTIPGSQFGAGIPGAPTSIPNHFRNATITNTYTITPTLLNQIVIGYNRTFAQLKQVIPFSWPGVGVNIPQSDALLVPVFGVLGSVGVGGGGQQLSTGQNQYNLQDNFAWVKGRHTVRVGAGAERDDINIDHFHAFGGLIFGDWPDFLLGLPGGPAASGGNGTPISNVLATVEAPGIFDRNLRSWDVNSYVQDDIKLTKRLTVNAGFRFERLGDLGELNGRNDNFDFSAADPNPPLAGTLQGFVVAGDFPGSAPTGVRVNHGSNLAIAGQGQNTLNPRLGFSWLLPKSNRFVLRGGYGLYHQKPLGQPLSQTVTLPPWGAVRVVSGDPTPTFANPFGPNVVFPDFSPGIYSPFTQDSGTAFANDFRPPTIHHYSLNVQTQVAHDLLAEVGYIGSRSNHLITNLFPDQALSASAQTPIRSETTNTLANLANREPIPGLSPANFGQIASIGSAWYHALEASLSKRFSHGLQFLASYTWTRDLTTESDAVNFANGGGRVGNQFDQHHNYGPDMFIHPHRFVLSGVYELPTPANWQPMLKKTLGGWKVAGVLTMQSGDPLSVSNINLNNVFGMNGVSVAGGGDFAQLSPTCTLGQVNTPGAVTHKLHNYINASCFTAYPIIGGEEPAGTCQTPLPDGNCPPIGTGFGNTRPGIVHGPKQANVDLTLAKVIPLGFRDRANLEFRAEAFNAFNTPQFANPDTNFSDTSFGFVEGTISSPRILQFALKINF
ncbi:MAG TPA: carboxypeptidase regulatory-like domain-containing protein [Candidatus Sulfotelmatobacter sp.]|nr:carboxypeptidase regulatory-like domain-containing protein [Candidatus Sulfotelmatobacter sp.]